MPFLSIYPTAILKNIEYSFFNHNFVCNIFHLRTHQKQATYHTTFTVILLIAVVIVAVLYVIALKKKSVDLLNQKECEIITAMIGAIVSVMLLSFLVYAFILR